MNAKVAMMLRPLATVLLIVAVAGVSACGRRGELDRPMDAQYERAREAAEKAGRPAPAKPSTAAPNRPFILDSLID